MQAMRANRLKPAVIRNFEPPRSAVRKKKGVLKQLVRIRRFAVRSLTSNCSQTTALRPSNGYSRFESQTWWPNSRYHSISRNTFSGYYRGPNKHINFLKLNFLPPPQNPYFGAPKKYVPHFLGRSAKRGPT